MGDKQIAIDNFGLADAFATFGKNVGLFDDNEDDLDESRIWEHAPVNIVEFVESPRFMNSKYNPSTGIGAFPCVMDDLVAIFGTDARTVAPLMRESFFSEGVGTGKSTKLAWLTGYMAYKLLCLRNPIQWMNHHGAKLLPNSKISIILISRTEENAKEVVFGKLNQFVAASPWFAEFNPPDAKTMSKIIFDALPHNRNHIKLGKLYKNITLLPGSSSEFAPLGKDLIFGVLDEASKYSAAQDRNLTDEDTDQAEVLYAVVKSRITSRFADNGHLCCVGNPEHAQDFLQRSFKRVAGDPLVYTVQRRSVWSAKQPDYDPDLLKEDGTPVTPHFFFDIEKRRILPEEVYLRRKRRKKNIDSEILRIPFGPTPTSMQYYDIFRDRPEVALRDYAGIPTSAVGMYWPEALTILPSRVNKDRVSPIPENNLQPMPEYKDDANEIPDFSHIIDIVREDWAWYGIHIDLAENGDSAVLVLSHPTELTKKKSPKIKIDLIYRFKPSQLTPFQLRVIRDLVWWLWKVKKFPIGIVSADKWNSLEMLQAFAAEGLNAQKLSVDSRSQELFDTLKWCIIEKRLDFFEFHEFDAEIYGLEKNGKRVEKNKYGSDDVCQGVAGSVWNSTQLAILDLPINDDSWDVENDIMPGENFGSSAEIF